MNILVEEILRSNSVIAIVGISPDENRESHIVGKYLQTWGYKIVPINPKSEVVLGEHCYPTLESCPIQIDIVNIFRRNEFVPPIVDSAIKIKANVIWMQLGVFDETSSKKAIENGLAVVMDKCIAREHSRLMGLQH
ncbi:CoA-binding protein [SAR202 cluster bacterium AC-409-J13_OGT_754m]|nr:CoA-binding protein [SAR202 cluster bacterium AC-409-J13_OGT_754m]